LKARRPRLLYASGLEGDLVSSPALSPDGVTVAFVESDRRGRQCIRLLDWDTGRVRALTEFEACSSGPAWSRDGERLAFVHGAGHRSRLTVVSRKGGVLQDTLLPIRSVGEPTWNPDGRGITYVAVREGGGDDLVSLDFGTGSWKVLCSSPGALEGPRWGPRGTWLSFGTGTGGTSLLNAVTGAVRPCMESIKIHGAVRWVWQ
jgi:Tol biopolymer transport system component